MIRLLSYNKVRFGLLAALIPIIVLAFSALQVQAITYNMTITSPADGPLATLLGNGTCELREALSVANLSLATPNDCLLAGVPNAADDFTIGFAVGILPATI